jgi:hypothetical protein
VLGSDILEVTIGIVFVFVLVSTICSAVREGIEAWLKTRASFLEYGIRQLLNDPHGLGIAKELFNHPLISGLYADEYVTPANAKPTDAALKKPPKRRLYCRDRNLPSYIPARNFALALMDIAASGPVNGGDVEAHPQRLSLQTVRANLANNIRNAHVRRALLSAVDSAQGNLDRAQANLEAWYDSSMDRVSGWYKRATHWMILVIALVLAVVLNINTITIADYLFRHDSVRSTIVASVEKTAGDAETQKLSYADARQQLEAMHLPMGWNGASFEASLGAPRTRGERAAAAGIKNVAELPFAWWDDCFAILFGWLITAFAATLGAPFWFDVLNKVMVIRSTVKPHEKSKEEGSEDRADTSPPAALAPPPTTAAALATAPPAIIVPSAIIAPASFAGAPTESQHAPTSTAGGATPMATRSIAGDPASPAGGAKLTAHDDDPCDVGRNTVPTPDDRLPAADGGVA